jgi:tRNA-dihydrouridine synthase
MAELSHRALRELIEGFGGCDEYYTEMISAGGLLGGGPFESWYTDGGPKPEKVVYQLVGSDPGRLAGAAAFLDSRECAGIDINMGCAAPAIRRTGAGAAWMSSIDNAGKLVAMVRKSTKKRLSVKLRLGGDEDFDYLVRFCQRLEAEGLDRVALHPRTTGEKFRRRARWEYVYRLQKELDIPVVGNGDIADAPDLLRRAREMGLSGRRAGGIMVGRGAVQKPWIFAEAGGNLTGKDINLEETGLRFLELLARYQPPEFQISRARRFFGYFCDNLTWGNHVKNILNRENTAAGMARAWSAWFREHPDEAETWL